MTGNSDKRSALSLYFHIPFCSKKCPYCHFYVISYSKEKEENLTQALVKELESYQDLLKDRFVPSIYFGGGTPSKLSSSSIQKILSKVSELCPHLSENAEITLEANPEDLEESYLKRLQSAGINRLSIGVQSLDDSSLQTIGRKHAALETIEKIHLTARIFENITIDLMYDLPNQTLHSFENTLKNVKNLPITHVSLYNLVIEENSAYYRKKDAIQKKMPKEKESLQMLEMAISSLEEMGLKRYEISAFAKDGYISCHNSGYWLGREFLGLGPSAFSYLNGSRFQNILNFQKYIELIEKNRRAIDFTETLDQDHSLKELFLVELRMLKGVLVKRLEQMPKEFKDAAMKKVKDRYLEIADNRIRLSKKGTLFYDAIASDLI